MALLLSNRSVKAANPKRLGAIERHPHYVTRRYAHFAASLLALHSGLDDLVVGIGGEEMLLNDLATLRVEVRPVTRAILSTNHVWPDGDIAPPNRLQPLFTRTNLSAVLPSEE